jgi:hypothetical protein
MPLKYYGKIISKRETAVAEIPFFIASRQTERTVTRSSLYTHSQVSPEDYGPSYPGFPISYSQTHMQGKHHEGSTTFF